MLYLEIDQQSTIRSCVNFELSVIEARMARTRAVPATLGFVSSSIYALAKPDGARGTGHLSH